MITDLALSLKRNFNSAKNYAEKLIILINNLEIDIKIKSRALIALNDICLYCFESIISIFSDVLKTYTYVIDLLHQEFNFIVRFKISLGKSI